MNINWGELRTHTQHTLLGTFIAGGSAFILREIYQLGIKGFTTTFIDDRRGGDLRLNGKLVYLVVTYEIYKIADKIFEQLGWREEISRMVASILVGSISSLALILAARNNTLAAYLVTGLTVLRLGLWAIAGVILMADGLKGTIETCFGEGARIPIP